LLLLLLPLLLFLLLLLRYHRQSRFDVPKVDMRLQRSKPRAFKKFPGRDIIRLSVNHDDAASVLHHQIVEGVKETLAHPKALHLGSDAQPDCGDEEKEKMRKISEYTDHSVFVFRVSKA